MVYRGSICLEDKYQHPLRLGKQERILFGIPPTLHPLSLCLRAYGDGLRSDIGALQYLGLGDFNVHDKAPRNVVAQKSMATMTTFGLSWVIMHGTLMAWYFLWGFN